jgi:hypothetical protein
MIQTRQLTEQDIPEIENFCNICKTLGYRNNESMEAMKFDWCQKNGSFWGNWYNNKLIAISGEHSLPEVGTNAIRILFRGCQIENPYKGLTSYHMNIVPFRHTVPFLLEQHKDKEFFISTNIKNDSSGRMLNMHRVMHLLQKKGIVELYIDKIELYYTLQTVWKLNKEKYVEIRNRLEAS